MPKRPDVRTVRGPWPEPPDDKQLPKISIVATRPDNLHTVVTCWPTDEELRLADLDDLIDRYFKPALAAILPSYRSGR